VSVGDTPVPGFEQFELINPAGRCRFGVGEAQDGRGPRRERPAVIPSASATRRSSAGSASWS
jgi:hypothetical protein